MAETTIAADSIDETTDADMMIVVAGTGTMTVAEDMTDMTIAEEAAMTGTMIAEKVIDMVTAEKVTGTGTDEETDMASDETTETETDTEAAGSIKMRQQRFREKCFFYRDDYGRGGYNRSAADEDSSWRRSAPEFPERRDVPSQPTERPRLQLQKRTVPKGDKIKKKF